MLLAGPDDTTDIVANYLARYFGDLVVVVEEAPSRIGLARRRARRVGWPTVLGQALFVLVVLPVLRWRGRNRTRAILAGAGLDRTPFRPVHHVRSVNGSETTALLHDLRPAMVVVNGTRIISRSVLASLECPIVNTHAGITPRYRGVHGGYWALAESRPEDVGTTVHLVDPGIDTGNILGTAHFAVTPEDSIATYPYLHLVAGLPLLAEVVQNVLAGNKLIPPDGDTPVLESRLYLHPTLWGYVRRRVQQRVR